MELAKHMQKRLMLNTLTLAGLIIRNMNSI